MTPDPTDPDLSRRALAERATLAPPPPSPPPASSTDGLLIDFDDGIVETLGYIKISGQRFAVPPMSAEVVEHFHQIKDIDLDLTEPGQVTNALDVMRGFIVRCVAPEDQDRCREALGRSRMTLRQLMERGAALIQIAAGFPTSPPSSSDASSPSGGGSTPAGTAQLPVVTSPG